MGGSKTLPMSRVWIHRRRRWKLLGQGQGPRARLSWKTAVQATPCETENWKLRSQTSRLNPTGPRVLLRTWTLCVCECVCVCVCVFVYLQEWIIQVSKPISSRWIQDSITWEPRALAVLLTVVGSWTMPWSPSASILLLPPGPGATCHQQPLWGTQPHLDYGERGAGRGGLELACSTARSRSGSPHTTHWPAQTV